MQTITKDHSPVLEGILELRDVVASTFGAAPRNVSITHAGGGASINDGVKVIQLIQHADPPAQGQMQGAPTSERRQLKQLGVDRVRRAAEATWRTTGDGTTSTALIMAAICKAGWEQIAAGADRYKIAEELKAACAQAVVQLKNMARKYDPADEDALKLLTAVAGIAMHGHAWAPKIAELLHELGVDGAFGIEASSKVEDMEVEITSGFRWDAGLYTLEQANTRAGRLELGEALVAVTAGETNTLEQLHGVLSCYDRARKNGETRPLVIVAQHLGGNALSTLVDARTPSGARVPIYLIKCPPKYGYAVLEDLAAVFGTKIFDAQQGNPASGSVALEMLGRAHKLTATDKSSTWMPATDESSLARIAVLEELAKAATGEEEEALRNRIANLHGKYGVIRMPYTTDTDFGRMREMVEDCYRAVQSAMLHGVLPGCGKALAEIACGDSSALAAGADEIFGRLYAGRMDEIRRGWWTQNVMTGETGDAVDIGVLDNAASVCAALSNAVAEAAELLNTEYFIVNNVKDGQ